MLCWAGDVVVFAVENGLKTPSRPPSKVEQPPASAEPVRVVTSHGASPMEALSERASEAGMASKEATLDTHVQDDVIATVGEAQEEEAKVEDVIQEVDELVSKHVTPAPEEEARAPTMMLGKTPTLPPPSHDVTNVSAHAASRRDSLTIPTVDVRDEPQVVRKLSSAMLEGGSAPAAPMTLDTVMVEVGERGRTPLVTLTPAPPPAGAMLPRVASLKMCFKEQHYSLSSSSSKSEQLTMLFTHFRSPFVCILCFLYIYCFISASSL